MPIAIDNENADSIVHIRFPAYTALGHLDPFPKRECYCMTSRLPILA